MCYRGASINSPWPDSFSNPLPPPAACASYPAVGYHRWSAATAHPPTASFGPAPAPLPQAACALQPAAAVPGISTGPSLHGVIPDWNVDSLGRPPPQPLHQYIRGLLLRRSVPTGSEGLGPSLAAAIQAPGILLSRAPSSWPHSIHLCQSHHLAPTSAGSRHSTTNALLSPLARRAARSVIPTGVTDRPAVTLPAGFPPAAPGSPPGPGVRVFESGASTYTVAYLRSRTSYRVSAGSSPHTVRTA
jgi:hypothetical protein